MILLIFRLFVSVVGVVLFFPASDEELDELERKHEEYTDFGKESDDADYSSIYRGCCFI